MINRFLSVCVSDAYLESQIYASGGVGLLSTQGLSVNQAAMFAIKAESFKTARNCGSVYQGRAYLRKQEKAHQQETKQAYGVFLGLGAWQLFWLGIWLIRHWDAIWEFVEILLMQSAGLPLSSEQAQKALMVREV